MGIHDTMSVTQTPLVAGRYRLVQQLGQGGMGRVWLARDEVLHRDVAVKEVSPPEGLPAEERAAMGERSLREARAIARLSHRNVVRVYDVVRQEPWPWIVMEYVPSRSLDQVLRDDGTLTPAEAARMGLAVLAALCAAHRIDMLHRDVKPGNVLLSTDGRRVVLTDFGLAIVPDDATVTRPGLIIGSPAFMAPERATQGISTAESDMWSLGATLHAAVEGRSPYSRGTSMATLAALATGEPDPAPHAGPLGAVIEGLLRREPGERLAAPEVERLLRQITRGARNATATTARHTRGRHNPSPPLPRLPRPSLSLPSLSLPSLPCPRPSLPRLPCPSPSLPSLSRPSPWRPRPSGPGRPRLSVGGWPSRPRYWSPWCSRSRWRYP